MAKRNADKKPKAEGLRPKKAESLRPKTEGLRAKAQGVKRRQPKAPGRFPKVVSAAVRAVLDKKAEDVIVLDLRQAGGFTDFFVICTGGNSRQIMAIADGVRDTLKRDLDERPTLTEGFDRSEWILLDYFNFVVHVFSRDCRAFYGLERLWGNAERHEVSD
jgi:ribosome-associated protein